MEIILRQTVDNLGQEGDIVKVKAGYARNYLVPKQMAATVSKANLAQLKQDQTSIQQRLAKQQETAKGLAERLEGHRVTIVKRAGEGARLYGSVTNSDIAEALAAKGYEIDRRNIRLSNPIKDLGETKISIKVGYQTTAEVVVQVVPKPGSGQVEVPEVNEPVVEVAPEAEAEAEATE